jgi:hypothetical protein
MRKRTRPVEDFAAEVESHLQLEIDLLQEEGLNADEARALAHRRFGNVAGASERFYESGRWLWRDRLSQDLRYASRMLRHSPGFAAIAILTIAIGVGGTTAMFSVVDATLLHPLPYPHPEQLVGIEDDLPGVGAQDVGLSQPEWVDLQRSGIFDAVSPAWFDENNLTGASQPERVRLSSVAPNFFALLGVAPQLGRAFPPADRSPGFSTGACGSTPICTESSGSCLRGFARPVERFRNGVSTSGQQRVSTAHRCRIIRRATSGTSPQRLRGCLPA